MIKLQMAVFCILLLAEIAPATTENLSYVNYISTQYQIESSIEKSISSDFMVQDVKCNLFENKSILVRIYLADNMDARSIRYGNLEALKSAVRGHALAVGVDPSVGDMIVQIRNSTAVQCSMRSARSLITMSLQDLQNQPGRLEVLVPKMLSTMNPVIGSHLVSGKFMPVDRYGECFNP